MDAGCVLDITPRIDFLTYLTQIGLVVCGLNSKNKSVFSNPIETTSIRFKI